MHSAPSLPCWSGDGISSANEEHPIPLTLQFQPLTLYTALSGLRARRHYFADSLLYVDADPTQYKSLLCVFIMAASIPERVR